MSLLETLQQRLGGQTVDQISRKLGTDSGTTGNAIDAALPLLLSAVAHNARTGQAQAIDQALAQDHDGRVLDDVPGFLNQAENGPGAGILRHVLGSRQPTIENGLSQASGLDAAKVGQLLTMLAPLVMGALGKAKQERGLDAGGLSNLLGNEQEELKQSAPGVMGMLTRFLDRNADGSIADEVGGMIGKAFGNKR